MGWYYEHKPQGLSTSDYLKKELSWESNTAVSRVLEIRVKQLRVAYAAVETIIKDTGERKVWAFIALIQHCPKSYWNFGYKLMDETVGPVEAKCPASVLDRLTPTSSGYALEWRERCRKHLEEKKNRLSIRKGMTIKTDLPVHFVGRGTVTSRGGEFDTFLVVSGRRNHYKPVIEGKVCNHIVHIPNIHNWGPVTEVQ